MPSYSGGNSEAMTWRKLKGQVPPAPIASHSDGEVSNGNTPPQTTRGGFRRALAITSSSGKRNGGHRHAFYSRDYTVTVGKSKKDMDLEHCGRKHDILATQRKNKTSPRAACNEFQKCWSTLVCSSTMRQSNEQRCYRLDCFYASVWATKINSNSFQDS